MTAPDIHTGSAILQARGQVIADMARAQNQASENVVKSLQGVSDNLHRWQDRLDKQAQLKADNDYKNATLDEARRMNDANIQKMNADEAYRQANMPYEQALKKAQTNYYNSGAAGNWREVKSINDVEKQKNSTTPTNSQQNGTNTTKDETQTIEEAKPMNPFFKFLQGVNTLAQKKAGR